MSQTRFTTWKSAVDSFPLGQQNIGNLKPGRYNGFAFKTNISGLTFKLTHPGVIPKTLDNGSTDNAFGAVVMPTGVIIHETTEVELTLVDNVSGDSRVDLVICEHNYSQVIGGVAATFSIITGTPGDERPALPNPDKQIIVGELNMAGNTAGSLGTVHYTPEPVPLLGDATAESFYLAWIQAQVHADIDTRALGSVVNIGGGHEWLKEIINNVAQFKTFHSSNNSIAISSAGDNINIAVSSSAQSTAQRQENTQLEKTSDFTLIATDTGKTIYVDVSGGDVDVTIDGDLPSYFHVAIVQVGAGTINYLISNSAVLNKRAGLVDASSTEWGTVYLEKRATTTKDFLLTGDLDTL